MITFQMYKCEDCGHSSRDRAEIEECEASGVPPLPEWARSRVGQRVRGFGEAGIKWGTLRSLEVHRREFGGHYWFARGDFWLSHNQDSESGGVPLSALDPMQGWDFLRYADRADLSVQLAEWSVCCVEYGIEPNPSKTTWAEDLNDYIDAVIASFTSIWSERAGL